MPLPASMYCCSALTMSCHPPLINTHPPAHVPRDISPSSTKQLHPSLLPHRLPQPPIRPPSPSCRRWRRRNAASLASCPSPPSFPPPRSSPPSSYNYFLDDSCRFDLRRIGERARTVYRCSQPSARLLTYPSIPPSSLGVISPSNDNLDYP